MIIRGPWWSRNFTFIPQALGARFSTKVASSNVASAKVAPSDPLRPYQRSCIEAIKQSLDRHKRPAVSLPTGSGKTHVFSYLLQHVKPMYPEDVGLRTKVLVIVNRRELMHQSLRRIRETHPDLAVLPISSKHAYNDEGDVFVSTYQTLMREARLRTIDASKFKLIVIDEAHHSVAPSYIRILSHFNAVVPPPPESDASNQPLVFEDLTSASYANATKGPDPFERQTDPDDRRVHVVGFSATFWRNDGEFLRDVYDEVAFHENINSMVENGYLCPAKITKIKLSAKDLRPLAEESSTVSAQDFFQHPSGLDLVFNAWNANSHHKSTVIFGCSLAHVKALETLFRSYGVDARCVHGNMSEASRADVLARFAAGEFPVLFNCQVLTEGTDIPRIDQVMIARGIRSTGLTMQMIGRGLRPHDDKEFCNVILFSNFMKFEANVDFIPQLQSLFEKKTGRSSSTMSVDLEEEEVENELAAPEEMPLEIDYGKLMLETRQFEPGLLASSSYRPSHPLKSALSWLEWKKSYYLFPVDRAGYYSIKRQPAQGLWVANYVKRINRKYTTSEPVIASSNIGDVLAATETQALRRWGKDGVRPLRTNAGWHFESPTPKQLKFFGNLNLGRQSGIDRGTAAGLLNLNSIGCKLTPELVDTVRNLIGRYKSETREKFIALEKKPLNNSFQPGRIHWRPRGHTNLVRSR